MKRLKQLKMPRSELYIVQICFIKVVETSKIWTVWCKEAFLSIGIFELHMDLFPLDLFPLV